MESNNLLGHIFAHKLKFITSVLIKNGISYSTLLDGVNISIEELDDQDTKINREQIIRFYRNIVDLKIPGIGLILGKSVRTNHYGLYGCTMLSCIGLRKTLEFAIRYHDLATRTINMSLVADKEQEITYFRFEDLISVPELYQFNIELQAAIMLTLSQECLGDNSFYFDELKFSYPKPKHAHLYEEFFHCPISYDHAHNEFVMTNDKLLLPTQRSNPFAIPILLDQCDAVLNSIEAKNEFLITINQWVATNMQKNISAEQLSAYLCITPRTLRRKLAEHGTNFREILQKLRCDAAKKLITETQLTMEDIASAIGFSDVSNFRAAFKKWTGHSPSSLR
ncbi:AraC family transcriptional regulator [Thalassotalea sp. G2M2-11]|uniref:AraC family transcriptional regulator n=1 Tax=Thalassotalea sp. G2M2-11 TaxID=2787627 RepID=UPI0019D2BEAD|nr:AraC family transcriptional regulator [Thalassotalea sp. G2M2-11]